MTPTGGDWLTPRPRPLPRPVTPAVDATRTSYIGRLARANRLDTEALRIHLTRDKRKSASVPADTWLSSVASPAALWPTPSSSSAPPTNSPRCPWTVDQDRGTVDERPA